MHEDGTANETSFVNNILLNVDEAFYINSVLLDVVVYLMPCSFKFVFISFIGAHVVIVSMNDLYFKQSAFLHFLIAHWMSCSLIFVFLNFISIHVVVGPMNILYFKQFCISKISMLTFATHVTHAY